MQNLKQSETICSKNPYHCALIAETIASQLKLTISTKTSLHRVKVLILSGSQLYVYFVKLPIGTPFPDVKTSFGFLTVMLINELFGSLKLDAIFTNN